MGDGVVLRPHRWDDARAVLDGVMRNYDHLRTFMEWIKPDYSINDANQYIERSIEGRDTKKGLSFGIIRGQDFIGSIDLSYFDEGPKATEIGYWIDSNYEGKGIISRAVSELIDLAFSELGMNRVQIRCATANVRSAAIPERFGFIKEGVQRQAIIRDGKLYDFAIYGLLAAEWDPEKK